MISKNRSSGKSLETIRLFSRLSEEERLEIEPHCQWRTFLRHQSIIDFLDQSDNIYFISAGTVRAISYSYSGKAVTYRDIGPGEFFGELSAIDKKPRSSSVEAITRCIVAQMSSKIFWELMNRHPKLMEDMLQYLSFQIRRLTDRVFEFSTLAVNNRIHAELLRLCREVHFDFDADEILLDPAPTHTELANRISTHREAVTREFNRLAQKGVLERKGNQLRIKDIDLLEKMVDEVIGY